MEEERNLFAYNLRDADYKPFVETIGGGSFEASYLSWSVCWDNLKSLYPLARHEWIMYTYGDKPFAGIMQPDGSVIVHCKITYETEDGDSYVHDEYLAVRDNRNQSVQNPNSAEMENTYRRALAKGVSTLTGFGIELWMNEDIKELERPQQTLLNGEKPKPGGVTVDQNVKLDALMRDNLANKEDKEKLKAMKDAGWEGVTEEMATILIADVKAGIVNNRQITMAKRNKTIKLVEDSEMSKDKKNKALKWLAIDARTNLEVDHFITTNKLQEN
tara:strand:- start:8789 stop:9607 length:819 start_codon:yes stop_codon:yes gene_type:complete